MFLFAALSRHFQANRLNPPTHFLAAHTNSDTFGACTHDHLFFVLQTLYYQQWVAIGRKAVTLQTFGHITCYNGGNGGQLCEWWPDQYALPILDSIVNDVTSLLNLDEMFKLRPHRRSLGQGECCTQDLKKWRSEIEGQVKAIKPFRDFL